MKIQIVDSILLLALGGPLLGAPLQINILPTVGCATNSPNFASNVTNIMAGLQNQERVPDWTTPPSWRPFDYLKWPTLASSTNSAYKLWLGSSNPGTDFGPSFANEMGNTLDWCLTVHSLNGTDWQTKDLYYSIVCSYPSTIPSSTGNLVKFGATNQVNFSATAIGVNYDQSGNPIVYTNGQPPTTPIRDFYYVGERTTLPVGNETDLVAVRTLLSKPGFTLTYTVWHQAANGSRDAEASIKLFTDSELVPKRLPSALAYMLAGQPNLLYRVEVSTTLQPGSWATLHSNVREGTWFTNQFNNSQKFFRAVTP